MEIIKGEKTNKHRTLQTFKQLREKNERTRVVKAKIAIQGIADCKLEQTSKNTNHEIWKLHIHSLRTLLTQELQR